MTSRCCWFIEPEIEIRSNRNGSKPKHIESGYSLQPYREPSKRLDLKEIENLDITRVIERKAAFSLMGG